MRKAVVVIVLLGAALFSTDVRSDETLFSDSFETYPAGTQLIGNPGGWYGLYNSVNDPYNNIITDQYGSDGTKSLQLYGAHSGCWAAGVSHAVSLPTEFIMEVDMMASGEIETTYPSVCADDGHDIATCLYSDFNPWGHGVGLAIFSPVHIVWAPPSVLIDNTIYMRWYNFRMKINRITGFVDYWVDGVYLGQRYNAAYLTWGPTLQHLYFQSGGGKGWIDKVRVYTDNTAPVTTLSLAGTPGENGTYWSDVVATLAAADGPDGSGVAYTEYSLNGGGTWTRYSGPVTVAAEGSTIIDYRSVDKLDKVEPFGWDEIRIDRIAPAVNNTDPANGATNVPVSRPIAIAFSETVQPGANYASIRLYKARIDPSKAVAATMSIEGNVLSIAPDQPLIPGTIYRVVVPQGSVKDMAGHLLAADYPPYSFTTAP